MVGNWTGFVRLLNVGELLITDGKVMLLVSEANVGILVVDGRMGRKGFAVPVKNATRLVVRFGWFRFGLLGLPVAIDRLIDGSQCDGDGSISFPSGRIVVVKKEVSTVSVGALEMVMCSQFEKGSMTVLAVKCVLYTTGCT